MHNNLSPDVARVMLDDLRRVSQGRDRLHSHELRRERRSRGRRWRTR
jgi:hypothetical protein